MGAAVARGAAVRLWLRPFDLCRGLLSHETGWPVRTVQEVKPGSCFITAGSNQQPISRQRFVSKRSLAAEANVAETETRSTSKAGKSLITDG